MGHDVAATGGIVAALVVAWFAAGCATTTVETSGSALGQPLCRPGDAPLPVALVWLPQWRADQKEPAVREALAQRGIESFIAQHACLALAGSRHLGAASGVPTDQELLQLADGMAPRPQRVLLVVVRELGPRLAVGAPVVVEGGTEVVIEVRVLDATTAQRLADARTQWRNGGTFVVKGIASLDADMRSALNAALMPGVSAP
jgi:hypothetical protein